MAEQQTTEPRLSVFTMLAIPFDWLGGRMLGILEHIGSTVNLFIDALRWILRCGTSKQYRLGRAAIISQILRIGVRSIAIISLVSGSVGLILALQMAPPLDQFGSREIVARIVGVAVFRELGPLISAIVLTGFAGAAIAAEIGTMVVNEEIEALEAHALNPTRFLVVPRILATTASMIVLAVYADLVANGASLFISMTTLGIPFTTYWDNMMAQVKPVDFYTGLIKSGIFGCLIGLIACHNGLKVTGGADGVGRATTNTVVQSVVSIIVADLMFTAIFFILGLV
ncbi:MAG: ABC transporter permease [Phycisphaeraceae bacterium]|nr:ABC transporter permease [Phycisphaerales bacterium]MCB9861663.1 ABC transporter permease [Phycisphaeraceae bacterium]